jgi:hypothetical protein
VALSDRGPGMGFVGFVGREGRWGLLALVVRHGEVGSVVVEFLGW